MAERALQWDADHANDFKGTSALASIRGGVRRGLYELRETILKDEQQIKQSRKAAGLA